jgi:RimJ/RimL family protein N-acetyltransferase
MRRRRPRTGNTTWHDGSVGRGDGWYVTRMTAAHARQLITWRYPVPYERYDLGDNPEVFLDPAAGFVSLVDVDGALVAFRSFGLDGRVPGGAYDDTALDTGGGLRPDLTGRGLGRAALDLGLEHGCAANSPAAFRVTVLAGNLRALAVVLSRGFVEVARFPATATAEEYVQLVRRET